MKRPPRGEEIPLGGAQMCGTGERGVNITEGSRVFPRGLSTQRENTERYEPE